ncbi:conserved hypothetical [Prochlorococcus marinus subsp. pastoris str. CCMP1986]|uniref:Conserved hypothetical n=1 Tax=Prochlorococcus marinus subsp. pastoris (strain CCMP1986 / NIES-2087 / MED4) TaxID=59919 RepID=Q7V1L0_PROMP|nr:hypothetical protein PROCH_0540 [Prochlorococcus marinus str. EQPAC1]CAE19314.1 conserved hypothetical [Prochlorococcus marinus subsp. pastoris str. CCMP1986]
MIIKFSLLRLSIIILLVILFPLAQKQWLNLYLFDINNLSIYKLLYYLSGLIVPILVIINSLNKFTYYKFNFHKKNNNYSDISGKSLFIITLVILSLLSILISNYIFINLKIILNLLMINNEYLVQYDIDKQILFIVITSIFLIFKKTKFLLKKIILTNFFIFSIINWYSQINNSSLNNVIPFNIFKFENINFVNINFVNIIFLLAIETMFYLWSYISYNSYLSDWNVPRPYKKEVTPIFNVIIFYLLVILYYSILFK